MTKKQNLDPGLDQGSTAPYEDPDTLAMLPDTNDAYRVSGSVDQYQGARGLVQPDRGWRNEPIAQGGGINIHPETHEVMGNTLERMAQNVSQLQYDHSHTIAVRRGMPGKADYPTSGPRIPATLQFGLGPNYARPGPSGHDPVDTDAPTDYIANPQGLDKYVGAKSVLQDAYEGQGYQPGWTRLHESTSFPTMGTDLEQALFGPHSNKDVGQQLPRKGGK